MGAAGLGCGVPQPEPPQVVLGSALLGPAGVEVSLGQMLPWGRCGVCGRGRVGPGWGEQRQPHAALSCSSLGLGSLCRSWGSGSLGASCSAGWVPVPTRVWKGPPPQPLTSSDWGFLEGSRAVLGLEGQWLGPAPRGVFLAGGVWGAVLMVPGN